MAKYAYLLFNALVCIPVLGLSAKYDVKPYRKYYRLLVIFLIISVPFILWDVWAARQGHWLFNDNYTLPYRFLGLPIEEILFFITVPYAMIYVWDVFKKHYKDSNSIFTHYGLLYVAILAVCALLAIIYWEQGYTRSVALAGAFTSVILLCTSLAYTKIFILFQGAHLVLFFVSNTVLTAMPIISYGPHSIIGTRIGSIPIEDFIFSFSLVSLSIIVYTKNRKTLERNSQNR